MVRGGDDREEPASAAPRPRRSSGGLGQAAAERDHAARHQDGGPEVESVEILGWDPIDARWQAIAALCSASGLRVRRPGKSEQAPADGSSRFPAVALVALLEPPMQMTPSLEHVSQLKGLGLRIVAYGAGVECWPLSVRCRILLAGAELVLDSNSSAFLAVLSGALRDLTESLRERRGEALATMALAKCHGIIGQSESLLGSFRQLARASNLSDVAVLITGESGTGKELFASALHALDRKRCHHPFVPVNCAAINSGIAESELFGHVKGAFTNANRDHGGYLFSAQGGVLFLDEVAELALDLQAKLLRVLEDGRLFRVGSSQGTAVDIRIVAATNRDLREMVQVGRFREDLFHRLNVLAIHIAPLRERTEDVRLLVEHMVALRWHTGKPPPVQREFVDALTHLELKGNVRELGNIVIRALVAKSDRTPLGLRDLPHGVWAELAASGAGDAKLSARACPEDAAQQLSAAGPAESAALRFALRRGWQLDQWLALCELEMIEAALHYTKNNQSQAARLLGITPRSIYNKLRRPLAVRPAE